MSPPISITSLKSRKTRAPLKLAKAARIVVVGNGMVGAHLCQALTDRGLHKRFQITVFGEEPEAAYDRIRLSSYVDDHDAGRLTLLTPGWYEDHRIDLRTSTRVARIDRDLKAVHLADGSVVNYDVLVLATGSRPFVPPIPGANLPGVFVYRTISDIKRIISAADGKSSAAVIGGGLLGLEAAQAAQKLGLSATIIERATFLMPQQLNETAASLLQRSVEAQSIELRLGQSDTSISTRPGGLSVHLADDESLSVDLILVATGITPNSELAADAGLAVGMRGGVVVDQHLQTDDPRIFAIGECALLEGRVYGLAAPGYAMARHLADRLAGKRTLPIGEPDLSTRLKMLGVDVVTIGDPLEEGRRLEFTDESHYRMLVLGTRGELRGGLGVGPWPESGMIQSLFSESAMIRDAEEQQFLERGALQPDAVGTPVALLPNSRVICNCMSVTKEQLVACLANCGGSPTRLAEATGASSVCGSCRPLLDELCGAPTGESQPVAARSMLWISAAALIAVIVTIVARPPEMAQSVLSWWYKVDQFWRDNVVKQITGYSMLGIFLIGMAMSLRKRLRWLRVGHFAYWRLFHAALGLVALVVLFAHTGFRFGANLNFWLMFTFVGLNLAGTLTGIVSAVESRGTTSAALKARRLRPALTWTHIVLFWPLPVLLTFHILSVYLY